MKKYVIDILFLGFFLFLVSNYYIVFALGVGECHSPGNINNPLVKWSYPSGEVHWSKLEPQKDQYNFKDMDDFLKKVKTAGKKAFIQVLVSNPDSPETYPTVPQWVIDEGMHILNKGIPIQWDPIYLKYHEKILKAVADRYENSEYADTIEAVLIQGGGNYGEMTIGRKYCYGEPNADVMDPTNIYVREMARVFLGSEDKASELTKIEGGKIFFDTYFIKAVQNIIDIYARSFKKYPFVIQTGSGLSCQARVSKEVVDYGVAKYGNRFWMRNNGLGSFTGLGEGRDYDSLMIPYKDKTIIGFELGHPSYWCASEGGKYPKGISMANGACKWDTRDEAIKHNDFAIQYTLNTGATHICFQHAFFTERNKYPVDMEALQLKLEQNLKSSLLGITPGPTVPIQNSIVTPSPTRNILDAADVNNDGEITTMDYYYVVFVKAGAVINSIMSADINKDSRVNDLDLSLIRTAIKNEKN